MSECAEIDQPIKVLSAYTQGLHLFNYLHKNRIQFPVECFGTPTWPLFVCSGPPLAP